MRACPCPFLERRRLVRLSGLLAPCSESGRPSASLRGKGGHGESFERPSGDGEPPIAMGIVRPELLYLVHRLPYPPDKGDRIRAFHVLEWLSGWANVHLACLADEPAPREAIAALEARCVRVAVGTVGGHGRWASALASLARGGTATEGAFRSPTLRCTLRGWAAGTRYRAALASSSSMVPYLRMRELLGIPAVVDLVDVDSQKWFDYAAVGRGPKAWLYRTEGRRLRRLEQDLPSWARAVTLVSEAEADLYRRFAGPDRVHAVVNGVDLDTYRPRPVAVERGCVFVGALDYRPNVDGASWFCRAAWPEIHRLAPDMTLCLVGRRPTPAVRGLAEVPGVEVVGQVPDVRPYLAESAVVVVPLRIARGVQNKVLEAMAMGKAVVASPEALIGIGATRGRHLLVASEPREWVEAVGLLRADPGLRSRIGEEARRFVEAHHQWSRCLGPFGPLLGRDAVATGLEGEQATGPTVCPPGEGAR